MNAVIQRGSQVLPRVVWVEALPRRFFLECSVLFRSRSLASTRSSSGNSLGGKHSPAGYPRTEWETWNSVEELLAQGPPRGSRRVRLAPNLLVVVSHFPGEISQMRIESLRRLFPLAGLVQLNGPWMEGERRTGRINRGIVHVAHHQAQGWLERQFWAMGRGTCPAWHTIHAEDSPAEIEMDSSWVDDLRSLRVGICLSDRALFGLYEGLLTSAIQVRFLGEFSDEADSTHLDAVIWDDAPHTGRPSPSLERLALRFSPIPILAIRSILRPRETSVARPQGVVGTLAKPFTRIALLWELRRIIVG